ncbi:MAG TPA: ABC transporter permease [Acidimicrobiales bacterium]|nr:ABC transporter permease [Acidimicrobiales bacterium]
MDTDRIRSWLAAFTPPLAILALQLVLFPMPAGIWIRGAIVGLATSLLALGMALIYRSNRIINFAQGDLGAAPAVLVFLLLTEWGWPYPLAVLAGAASAFLLGGLVEVTVIRRFFNAPRLVLTVATIGLAQILTALAIFLPNWFDTRLVAPKIEEPFELRFLIGDVIFRANSIIALAGSLLAIVGLAVFLQGSSVGVAIRASADRATRAALLGVPVKRLQSLVWGVAALLAFTATFLRAGMVGLPVGAALSLGLLLRSLTALLLGRMTNLPVIGATAMALGVLELGVDWNSGTTMPFLGIEYPPLDAVLAVVVLVSLLLSRRGAARSDLDDQSSWQAADEVRPIPGELVRVPIVRVARIATAVVIGGTLMALPHFLRIDQSLKASAVLVYAILGLSIVVLTGWSGQVSLGQVAFFAIGAAVGGKATLLWNLDVSLAILVGGLAGAVAAVIVGLPALRFRGMNLAVSSFAFALATTAYLLDRQYFDWVPNERIPRNPLFGQIDLSSATSLYYLCLGTFVLAVFGLRGIRHSRTGRVMVAIRDNERAAQAFGVSAVRVKLTAFAISGFIAAAAGSLFIHHQQALDQGPYDPFENLVIFATVVVGGITSLPGAALGALYFQGAKWFLPGPWQALASGVGVLFVLLILPRGLGGLVFTIRDQFLRMVAKRKDIVVPSLLADSRVEGPEPEHRPLPGGLPSAPAKVTDAEDDTDHSEVAAAARNGGVS